MNFDALAFPRLSDEELEKQGIFKCLGHVLTIEDRTAVSNYVKLSALIRTPFDGECYTFAIWQSHMIDDIQPGDVAKIYYRRGGLFRRFKKAERVDTVHVCSRCGVLSEEDKEVDGMCEACKDLPQKPLIKQNMVVKSLERNKYK